MTCSIGAQSKLLVSTSTTFNASSERYDYIWESMQKHGRLVGARGITGTRSNSVERTRIAPYSVDGKVAFDMAALDLDKWLPRILGTAENNNEFVLAESLPAFYLLIDKVGGIFRYDSCYVDKALFHAEADDEGEQSLCTMVLDIFAKTETDQAAGVSWPSPEPTLATTENRTPYIMYEGVLTIDDVAYPFKEFTLAIDNRLSRRWVNSISATAICPQDRYVVLRTNHPFTSTERAAFIASTKQATAAGGVEASLVFTHGDYSTTFTMAGLQWQAETPVVRGKVEVNCPMQFVARMKGDDLELVVTNVSS